SSENLPDFLDETADVFFRSFRQDAMPESADPSPALFRRKFRKRRQITIDSRLELFWRSEKEGFIEVSLQKPVLPRAKLRRKIPPVVDPAAREEPARPERIEEIRGLGRLRIVTEFPRISARELFQPRHRQLAEDAGRDLARGRIEKHDDFGPAFELKRD